VLLERDDERELTDDQRESVASRELRDWIDGLRDSLDIERDLSRDDAERALTDIL
jgi:phytoene dehydrogenase-like protein